MYFTEKIVPQNLGPQVSSTINEKPGSANNRIILTTAFLIYKNHMISKAYVDNIRHNETHEAKQIHY